MFTEAACLREDDAALIERSAEHGTVSGEVCVEPTRGEDGEHHRFETLFFASTPDREE